MDISIKNIAIVSPQVIENLGMNPNSARTLLSRYEKQGIFTRIKRGYYINNLLEVEGEELCSVLFPESYISLDTVLYEAGIIKQHSKALYCISNKGGYEEINLGDYILFKYSLSLKSREGISIDRRGNFRANTERAFLDSLYLKLFSRYYPGESEYNLSLLDKSNIKELLPLYPRRVQQYYINMIDE